LVLSFDWYWPEARTRNEPEYLFKGFKGGSVFGTAFCVSYTVFYKFQYASAFLKRTIKSQEETKMKKLLCIVLVMMMAFATLAGCTAKTDTAAAG
jgi:multisubunit Na+/H+ antiporter MnhB subunit